MRAEVCSDVRSSSAPLAAAGGGPDEDEMDGDGVVDGVVVVLTYFDPFDAVSTPRARSDSTFFAW